MDVIKKMPSSTVVAWKGIHSGLDTNRTGIEDLPFTTPGCLLPGSDAGSDDVKPGSSFVIQNRQTSCLMDVLCIGHVLEDGLRFV